MLALQPIAVLTALLAAGPAASQEASTSTGSAAASPGYRRVPLDVVAFEDLPGSPDCHPVDARYGRCTELVRFLASPWSGVSEDTELAAIDKARLRAISKASFRLWEDLAVQWTADRSVLTATLLADGIERPPRPEDQWEALRTGDFSVSLPERAAWRGPAAWGVGTSVAGAMGWRSTRSLQPEGLSPVPELVLLRGRFAERLGYDGRPHDYELMDADPDSAGPFFEQLYPYRRGRELEEGDTVPLRAFDLPDDLPRRLATGGDEALDATLGGTRLREAGMGAISQQAHIRFEVFARRLGVQISQFALEDHTLNQMRVLASVTAMRQPPGSLEARTGRTRDLVAAALGQTDDPGAVDALTDPGVFALQGGFELRFEALPGPVVEEWMGTLLPSDLTGEAFLIEVDREARAFLGELLRPGARRLPSLEREELAAWTREALVPGADRERFVIELQRLGLALMVSQLPAEERDRVETWILLDHVEQDLASNLDETGEIVLSPGELAELSAASWASVLQRHGHRSAFLEQGLGAVDPTAICTTRDGRQALSEPVVRAVSLDVLVVAPDELARAEEVLWNARAELPFLLVDDPSRTRPELARMVGLPGGEALYRLRWRVWSGWHLFWDEQPLGDGTSRLALRTGAVCADTVLAPPRLVPTLVRAGLLEGELRPSTAARSRDLRDDRPVPPPPPPLDNDALISGVDDLTDGATEAAETATAAREAVDAAASPSDYTGLLSGVSLGGDGAELDLDIAVSERAEWLHELVRGPLERRAAGTGRLTLVLDSTDPSELRPLSDRRPRTPYERVQRSGGGEEVAVAAWALYHDGPGGRDAVRVAPTSRPRASVASESALPRWRRPSKVDYSLAAGLGAFPWRRTWFRCNSQDGDLDVVPACTDEIGAVTTEGLSADLQGLVTWWPGSRRRYALDLGLAAEVSLLHRGPSWLHENILYEGGEDVAFAWSWRPRGGFVLGLRHAPAPPTLWSGRNTWPWGSDRPDGTVLLRRSEVGLQTGFLAGTGYNGLEGSVLGELWWARALRNPRGRQASLTPYHPATLLGPYLRWDMGFVLVEDGDEVRYLEHALSHSLTVGVRTRLRLKTRPSVPEVSQ